MSKKNKNSLHSKNLHNAGYEMETLLEAYPELSEFVFINKFQTKTIDFSNPKAVKALNSALLKCYYGIDSWTFSDENLCPPIPGRVDYVHHLKDLINENSNQPTRILDIGTGATCIYPLLGNSVYKWSFVGTDIDKESLNNAQKIIDSNNLSKSIQLKFQQNKENIFQGVIEPDEIFAASMCNPPFYGSQYEAVEANARKLKGLGIETTKRNFGGNQNELWYKGGEKAFLHNYLYQSSLIKEQVKWFTSIVSKKENVASMQKSLTKLGAEKIKVIPMHQGNKVTRIVAWTFIK
ncbi:23S rRNA (adenine(1618)-N(6))-methyltransferase RlmF [Urechidicola vernalis]|uniref:Ribosomal RNA large subunit methyltransferase F n=1 Tax=Urechidicola vernalis TaxID=3075600 RepID=A0ABU2Y0V1_9FLAO|nr:23S rRNA (adenine(1618)-N(6))-methyltransferase RlmF [Urechidicola sp. P050]MDT0551812.1 23S rRNA (adenine(1618)-N(6))-methyltransferase RlmF [Urechidicola sp. P050]